MPMVDDVYGGSWLKTEDLPPGVKVAVTIEHVSVHTVGEGAEKERKLALRFAGKEKQLLLNVTNANAVAEIVGSRDYDHWNGTRIAMYVDPNVMFGGRKVGGIRIAAPPANGGSRPAPPPPTAQEFQADDSDVPF